MKKFYVFLALAAMAVGAMADDFVSDGSGNVYTFNALSQTEGTGVTLQDDGSYLVAADFTISEGDVLQLDNNAIIKIANGVRITVDGDADFAPADTAVVTRDVEGSNPKGFWMMGDNGNADLKNVTFEYVGVVFGGINSSLHATNCTFTLHNGKSSSSGALSFNASCGGNIVENCYFIENTLNAIGNGATNPVGVIIRNCLFWHNTTDNRNKPQINLTVGGDYDVIIADNEVIGGQFTMSGGIGLSNMMGLAHSGINIIENNLITDNRYGITTIGSVDAIIRNNVMVNNCFDPNPNNGGSCVSIYDSSSSANIYMEGNWMEGGLWGITVPTGAPNINLGKVEDPEAEDYNPGNNTFVNNGNGGVLYDLFNNGTGTIWAQGNTWNVEEQTEENIEEVIYHQVDDPSKGLVIFMPPHQVLPTAVPEILVDVQDEVVAICAQGEGEVLLYIDGEPVDNPVEIARGNEPFTVVATATAQAPGQLISDVATLEVTIPALEGQTPEDPYATGYWVVFFDKNGNLQPHQLLPGDDENGYQTSVALGYKLYGEPASEDAWFNIPFYFLVNGETFAANEFMTEPVYGDANENKLAAGENYWCVPVGYKYVVGILFDPNSDDMYMQISKGILVGCEEINADKAVANVRYFNMAGQEMGEANGLTIVVTTYTDGTTTAAKVIK